MKTSKGYTLIELLVVISIIAVLTALALTNFLNARQRATDSKKKSEFLQLKSALRLFYNDYNTYPGPTSSGLYINGCGNSVAPAAPSTQCTTALSANNTTYMRTIPDFNGSGSLGYGFNYCSTSNGDDFRLKVTLDNVSDPDIATSQTRCPVACGMTYSSAEYVVCAD